MNEAEALDATIRLLPLVEATPEYADPNNPTRGKCYPAAIALFIFLGGRNKGYRLMRGADHTGSHYWVQSPAGTILDPTAEQFTVMGIEAPYVSGKPTTFHYKAKRHLPILNALRGS